MSDHSIQHDNTTTAPEAEPDDDEQDCEAHRLTRLTVVAWRDPLIESVAGAIPTYSNQALYWWLPILGPTSTAMAHRWAGYAAVNERSTFTYGQIAATFGLGRSYRKVTRSIARLERFGVAIRHDDILAVRLVLPPLSRRLRGHLPRYLLNDDYPHTRPYQR